MILSCLVRWRSSKECELWIPEPFEHLECFFSESFWDSSMNLHKFLKCRLVRQYICDDRAEQVRPDPKSWDKRVLFGVDYSTMMPGLLSRVSWDLQQQCHQSNWASICGQQVLGKTKGNDSKRKLFQRHNSGEKQDRACGLVKCWGLFLERGGLLPWEAHQVRSFLRKRQGTRSRQDRLTLKDMTYFPGRHTRHWWLSYSAKFFRWRKGPIPALKDLEVERDRLN